MTGLDAYAGGARAGFRYEVVRQLRSQVAEDLTVRRSARLRDGLEPLNGADEALLAQSLIQREVDEYTRLQVAKNGEPPAGVLDGSLARAVGAAMFGAGPLQPLLEDPDLENVDLNGYDEVWATYVSGEQVRLAPLVDSDEELIEVVRALASHAGSTARPWSVVHPQLDLGLPGGVRISGLLAASARPQISIRRDRLGPQAFLDEVPRRHAGGISLVELGTIDRQCALFLAAAVRSRANIMIAGSANAGKTTLLRALANAIPARQRLVTIEQALELRLGREDSLHRNVVELETVLPSPEGSGGLDGADLVRRSKRMNPDRLIFGEVLAGPEARAMLEAMLQGGDGSMSTIHSRDARGAIARLIIGLGSLAEPVQPTTAAALIGQAIDFIVYVQQGARGRRVVTEILEISGYQGENVSCATIFASPAPDQVSPADTEGGAGPVGAEDQRLRAATARPGTSAGEAGGAGEAVELLPARRDPRIPLRRAELLARHGYTDELGEQLNTQVSRRRGRSGRTGSTSSATSSRMPSTTSSTMSSTMSHTRSGTPSSTAPSWDSTAGRAGAGAAWEPGSGSTTSAGGADEPAGPASTVLHHPALDWPISTRSSTQAQTATDPGTVVSVPAPMAATSGPGDAIVSLSVSVDGASEASGTPGRARTGGLDGVTRRDLDLPDDGRADTGPLPLRQPPDLLPPAPTPGGASRAPGERDRTSRSRARPAAAGAGVARTTGSAEHDAGRPGPGQGPTTRRQARRRSETGSGRKGAGRSTQPAADQAPGQAPVLIATEAPDGVAAGAQAGPGTGPIIDLGARRPRSRAETSRTPAGRERDPRAHETVRQEDSFADNAVFDARSSAWLSRELHDDTYTSDVSPNDVSGNHAGAGSFAQDGPAGPGSRQEGRRGGYADDRGEPEWKKIGLPGEKA